MTRDDRPDVERAIAQRLEQGLDRRVTDPAVLAYLGALVVPDRKRGGDARTA